MIKKTFSLFLIICLFSLIAVASAAPSTFNVTYNVTYGGLLWVNGTSIINASIITYSNDTQLLLAATPTNANYSYASMDLNGTLTTDNPTTYTLFSDIEDEVFNATVTVNFVAEATPTPSPSPDPDALTIDDSVGIAVVFGLLSIGVCVAFMIRRK
jgi:hypothetical protein